MTHVGNSQGHFGTVKESTRVRPFIQAKTGVHRSQNRGCPCWALKDRAGVKGALERHTALGKSHQTARSESVHFAAGDILTP